MLLMDPLLWYTWTHRVSNLPTRKQWKKESFYRTPRLGVSDFAILSLSLSHWFWCYHTYTKRAQRCVSIDQCETSKNNIYTKQWTAANGKSIIKNSLIKFKQRVESAAELAVERWTKHQNVEIIAIVPVFIIRS